MQLLSTDKILSTVAQEIALRHHSFPASHLDIGSGHGDLIRLLQTKFSVTSKACDYTKELFDLPEVELLTVDLNNDRLPYKENEFDLVTITEVVEHLNDFRSVIVEIFRVTKPGATVVITTPNILNLKSRVRFLLCGFFNLFGPLPFRGGERYSTGGHISPISSFYLRHALAEAGFTDTRLVIDKIQHTSGFYLLFLGLPIVIGNFFVSLREKKLKTFNPDNLIAVREMNSLQVMLGRTIICSAKKPSKEPLFNGSVP